MIVWDDEIKSCKFPDAALNNGVNLLDDGRDIQQSVLLKQPIDVRYE